MQLQNLNITNFRTIKNIEIAPGKLNVIVGPNGSGKSSILEAISFLLTGKAGANPVNEDATIAEVEAVVMGVPVYRKTGSRSGIKMNGKTTTHKSMQEWIESTSGITTDTLRVATSSGLLSSMNSSTLAAYLVNNNLIPAEIDMDTIDLLCTMSADAKAELLGHLPPAPMKFTMDEIQDAYSYFFSARPVLKKQIAELNAQANYTGLKPTRTLEQIDKELGELSAHAAEMAAYEKMMRLYQDTKNRRESVLRQLSEIDAKIKSSQAKPVDPEELKFLKNSESNVYTEILATTRDMQTIKSNISMFEKTMDNLNRPVCPISEKLICTTDKTAVKDEIGALLDENKSLLLKLQNTITTLNGKLQMFRDKITDFEHRRDAFREFENLYAKKRAIEAAVPVLPELPQKPKEVPDAASTVKLLNEERELIVLLENAERAAKEIPTVEKQLAVYDELVNLLCPRGGVREKIVEAAFEPLIEHCNERAKELGKDFAINLVSDEGIHILCKPADVKNFLPISAASSGEQLLAMLLILDAINALSGLGILVLDDLDKLDQAALESLFALLSNPDVIKPYDHIFVAMVNHEDSLKTIDKYKAEIDTLIAL